MDLIALLEIYSDTHILTLFGVLTGLIFGFSAQRSAFCLRASAVEFARGQMGPRMSVWLLAISTAIFWTQMAKLMGIFDPSQSRMMSVTGSYSGAIVGGLLFGVGMVMARGCSGRLLVLAATGNLRSVVSGLVFAVFAQMTLVGWLRAPRDMIASLWTTPGGRNIDLTQAFGLPPETGLLIGIGFALYAIFIARKNQISVTTLFMASGVGFAVAFGWVTTSVMSSVSFDPVAIESATFTGPSANTLMFLLIADPVLDFDIGLIAGVFIGAFISSILKKEFKFQGFENERNMRRALTGAALMGFGGMLAGGCAIGAGVSGGSIFAATAWIALLFFWIGAVLADWVIDQPHKPVSRFVKSHLNI